MKLVDKVLSVLFCGIIVFTSTTLSAHAIEFSPPFDVNVDAVYLVNRDTGKVIYSKNAQEELYPASLAKMVTAILAVENLDLNEELEYKFYLQDMLYNLRVNGIYLSQGGLLAGDELSVEELLYGVMLPSGADCALTLADAVGDGSLDYFVELMNKKVKEIGATNTHFTNPDGMHDPNQYTTAKDMYLIAEYLLQNEVLKEMSAQKEFEVTVTNSRGEKTLSWYNTNKMMMKGSVYYYPGIKGVKTGTLDESGYHLVSTCTKDGYEYMAVVMGGPIKDASGEKNQYNTAFTTTEQLYDWVFSNFKEKTILEKDVELDEVPVKLSSETNFVKVRTGESFRALLPLDVKVEDVQLITELPESVDAPIKEWDKLGTVRLMLKGEELGTVPLLSTQTITRSNFLYMLSWFTQLASTFAFKFIITFICVTVALFILLMVVRNYNQSKYRTVKRRRRM